MKQFLKLVQKKCTDIYAAIKHKIRKAPIVRRFTQPPIPEIKFIYRAPLGKLPVIRCSGHAYNEFLRNWDNDTIDLQMECKVMYLRRNNEVLGIRSLHKGGTGDCIIDPKQVFSSALVVNAVSIIIAINVPSGNLKRDAATAKTVMEIQEGAKRLCIGFLDAIVVSRNSYYSYADQGELYGTSADYNVVHQ